MTILGFWLLYWTYSLSVFYRSVLEIHDTSPRISNEGAHNYE